MAAASKTAKAATKATAKSATAKSATAKSATAKAATKATAKAATKATAKSATAKAATKATAKSATAKAATKATAKSATAKSATAKSATAKSATAGQLPPLPGPGQDGADEMMREVWSSIASAAFAAGSYPAAVRAVQLYAQLAFAGSQSHSDQLPPLPESSWEHEQLVAVVWESAARACFAAGAWGPMVSCLKEWQEAATLPTPFWRLRELEREAAEAAGE